jgi:hypothetical protein
MNLSLIGGAIGLIVAALAGLLGFSDAVIFYSMTFFFMGGVLLSILNKRK